MSYCTLAICLLHFVWQLLCVCVCVCTAITKQRQTPSPISVKRIKNWPRGNPGVQVASLSVGLLTCYEEARYPTVCVLTEHLKSAQSAQTSNAEVRADV